MIPAIALMVFTGCSKLAETFTVKVPVEATLELDVPAGGGDLNLKGGRIFYASKEYNTATDATVLKYKDKIKSIAANGGKVKIKLPPAVTSITLTNTSLQIRDTDNGALYISWDFEAKTYENNAELTLGTPKSGNLSAFSTALDKGANLLVELTGNSFDYGDIWKLDLIIEMIVDTKVL